MQALVDDVEGEPGGLPLLSTALLQLWRVRDGGVLRVASYRSTGGVQGAVARLAEDAYGRLPDGDQAIAKRILLRLAGGESESPTRRRLPLADVAPTAEAGAVVSALTDDRLLTVSEGSVEVCHESLFREWPRYRTWLEEDLRGPAASRPSGGRCPRVGIGRPRRERPVPRGQACGRPRVGDRYTPTS